MTDVELTEKLLALQVSYDMGGMTAHDVSMHMLDHFMQSTPKQKVWIISVFLEHQGAVE